MDKALMDECDKWLTERVRSRDMPHDFDDVTWVMHDFVLFLRSQADAATEQTAPSGETNGP